MEKLWKGCATGRLKLGVDEIKSKIEDGSESEHDLGSLHASQVRLLIRVATTGRLKLGVDEIKSKNEDGSESEHDHGPLHVSQVRLLIWMSIRLKKKIELYPLHNCTRARLALDTKTNYYAPKTVPLPIRIEESPRRSAASRLMRRNLLPVGQDLPLYRPMRARVLSSSPKVPQPQVVSSVC